MAPEMEVTSPKVGVEKRSVSIIIPVYNEELVIAALGRELSALMARNNGYDFEVVLVDNGSHDASFRELMLLHRADTRFKIIQLSRNFTADGGVAAGLKFASGDCAVLMDADLQDPPEVIDQFLAKWQEGFDVVFGVIESRQKISFLRRLSNQVFYATISFVSKGNIPPNVTAFRLMDRMVYEQLNRLDEANRFTRGLCSWVGFRQVGVPFHRAGRYDGESKVNFFDLLEEGLDAVFAFSSLPLRVITMFGLCISWLCLLFVALQFVLYGFFQSPFPGYRTLVVANMMMFGFLFISIGIMGEYVGRIFDNVKGRPNFIVRDMIGIEKLSSSHSASKAHII